MFNWNEVTALATAVLAIVTVIGVPIALYQLVQRAQLAHFTASLDALWKLDAKWESREMQRTRRAAAKALAEKQETADVDSVLDFFELLGLLVRRKVLDEELAWEFYHWLSNYWRLTREYVERVRRDNPAVWEYTVDLVQRLDRVEARRSGLAATAIVPRPEDVAEFLANEQAVGLDRGEGKG